MDQPDEDDPDDDDTYYDYLEQQRLTFPHLSPDYVLQLYVDQCNRSGLSFDVTLAVGGLVITGMIEGASKWLDEYAAVLEAEVPGDQHLPFSMVFRELSRMQSVEIALDAANDDETVSRSQRTAFINLSDATIFQGGDILMSNVRWRGRLSSVDGWTLGRAGRGS